MRSKTPLAIALVLAFAVYIPALGNRFALDDTMVAKAERAPGAPNELVHRVRPISTYFTSRYWKGIDDDSPLYRPVTVLSYAWTHAISGRPKTVAGEAFPHHLLNVLLNVACVLLLYLMLRPFAAPLAAAIGAGLFGVHAIHSEVVASIVGRADLLAFAFGAGALLAREKARHGARLAWLIGCGVLLFLAFGSKESAVAWPAFLIVYGVARSDRARGIGATIVEEAKPVLLAAAVPLLLFFVLRGVALSDLNPDGDVDWAVNPLAHAATGTRMWTAIALWGYGLLQVFAPVQPVSDYGVHVFEMVTSASDTRFLASLLALLALLGIGLWALRRHALVGLACLSFLGFSFVTTNLPLTIGTIFAERLYFLASVGLAFAVAWWVARPQPALRWTAIAVAAVWISGSAIVTWTRADDWKDDLTLARTDVERQPRSLLLRYNLAQSLRAAGDEKGFEAQIRAALEIEPTFATALNELASLAIRDGKWSDAQELLERGLASEHRDRERDDAKLHFNMGAVQLTRGSRRKALEHFETSLDADPVNFTRELSKFAGATRGRIQPERLLQFFDRGLKQLPGEHHWMLQRGLVLAQLKRYAEAVASLESPVRSLPGDPDRASAMLALADSYAWAGKRHHAVQMFQQLINDRSAPSDLRQRAEGLLKRLRPPK